MNRNWKLSRRVAFGVLVAGLVTPMAASAAAKAQPVSVVAAPVVKVSEQDANKTIHVSPGTRIDVDLHGSYDPPTVDNPTVLTEGTHSGGYPSKTDAKAEFTAISAGSATIASRLDSACMHPTPGHAQCMIVAAPLRISIVVDGPVAAQSAGPVGQSLTGLLDSADQSVGTALRR